MIKNFDEFINEALGGGSDTYLCLGYNDSIDFFNNGYWNPQTVSKDIDGKFVVVSSNKNLNNDDGPIKKAWIKKYGEPAKGYYILLSSFGDDERSKLIRKLEKALNSGKISFEAFLSSYKNNHGKVAIEDVIFEIVKELLG